MNMTFNGVSPNAILTKWGIRQKTEKIFLEYGKIPGTSVEYFIDSEEYRGYDRKLEFLIKDPDEVQEIFKFFNGPGKLVIEPGGYYKARVINTEHHWVSHSCGWTRFVVTFRIAPFFWLDSGLSPVTLTPPATLDNPGLKSFPLIRVHGSGDINLVINGRATTIKNIEEYIDIDSEYLMAYKGTVNLGENVIGAFPVLDTGINSISAPGASSLVITPRWREL